MKPHLRLAVILATILAMALAYLGGTFVSAQTSPLLMSPGAPAQTTAQRVAIQAANSLLLLDGEDDTSTHLPIVLRR